jgi:hypothetical protein
MAHRQDRIDCSRESKYVGIAKVNIADLEFAESRQIDRNIVEELKTLYRQTNCRRYDAANYVPVLVEQTQLTQMLKASNRTQQELKNIPNDGSLPFLSPSRKLLCPHGQHRIRAAQEFLPLEDQWWTVEIYLLPANGKVPATLGEQC